MAGITYFVALPFDVADGSVVVGEPIKCATPATAIKRAQGLWKVLGHTGAVAFSRTWRSRDRRLPRCDRVGKVWRRAG